MHGNARISLTYLGQFSIASQLASRVVVSAFLLAESWSESNGLFTIYRVSLVAQSFLYISPIGQVLSPVD